MRLFIEAIKKVRGAIFKFKRQKHKKKITRLFEKQRKNDWQFQVFVSEARTKL